MEQMIINKKLGYLENMHYRIVKKPETNSNGHEF